MVKIPLNKIVFMVAFGLALCFAQEAPERLAVYASGSNDAGIDKSMGNKLLATMVQSGKYAEIGDPASFQDELAKGKKSDLASIVQAAKQHGADYVCAVSITEVFGTHTVNARLIKIDGSQVVKTGLVDRSLKSLEDLTAVSNELARQLITPAAPVAAVPPVAPVAAIVPVAPAAAPPVDIVPLIPVAEAASALPADMLSFAPQQDAVPQLPPPQPPSLAAILAPASSVAVAAPQKQCARTYNINELLSKIKDGFPAQLKDCSSKLAKDMLTPASFGGKKLEPKSFMTQCPIDGIKKELPDGFPGVDKVINSLTNFVQGIMNTAMAGAALDPKKLISAVSSMNVNELLNEIKSLSNNECVVDTPYNPAPSVSVAPPSVESSSGGGNDSSAVSFGIRAGINFSHTYAEYDNVRDQSGTLKSGDGNYGDIFGMQFGFVLDIAANEIFHIQPGLMYIQKGMKDDESVTSHYLELPLLLSLKLSVLRLNAGPYVGLCVEGGEIFGDLDLGFSTGLGFDIGMFYIGLFYDYGFADMSDVKNFNFYNRTLGFNLGINL